jgi:sialate O-acetylesterase
MLSMMSCSGSSGDGAKSSDENSSSYTDADGDADSDSDTDTDSDTDNDADSDADSDSDSDSDTDSDSDDDSDADGDGDTNADIDTDTDGDADTDTGDAPNSLIIEEYMEGVCQLEGVVERTHSGFQGSGYANTDNSAGSGLTWQVDAATDSEVILEWRFAGISDRPAKLAVNGTDVDTVSFPSTNEWTTWATASISISLPEGSNSIRLEATNNEGLANIDNMTVIGDNVTAGECDADPAKNVALKPPFDSHMVLQRGQVVPVWGTASGTGKVTVTVGDQSKTGIAFGDGTWRVMLDPMNAGGPYTVTVAGANTVTLEDVYVGEVWQAAGQSNMDTRLSFYSNLASDITSARHPKMRYFTVRQPGTPPTTWEVVSPATAGDLSAMAYFFGKEILKSTDVAVGLVVTAVGGTTITSWLDPDTIAANPGITNSDRGTMWNEWVSPVVGYGIRGTIWIQGEQNCNAADAPGYGNMFRLLINGWRKAWGQGDFPFYFGGLSNIHTLQTDPNNTSYVAMVREGQRMALALPNTAMTVNMDIGSSNDWHFPNKPEAGRRFSLPARALDYGESDLVYSGPLYQKKTISGNAVTLHFDHVGGGLEPADGGALKGFAIAGDGGKWVWGDAKI